MAELIRRAVPSMEMVRLVSSGTEAAMSALRVARGATGRDFILKFDGCYHGHADSLLVKAGSGGATFGVPDSLGVPPRARRADPHGAVQRPGRGRARQLEAHPDAGRGGDRGAGGGQHGRGAARAGLPRRAARAAHAPRRAPDLRRGDHRLPRGAGAAPRRSTACVRTSRASARSSAAGSRSAPTAGRARVMERVAPLGRRLPGGHALRQPARGGRRAGHAPRAGAPGRLRAARGAGGPASSATWPRPARRSGRAGAVNRVGSMLTVFFPDGPVTDYASAKRADTARYARFFHAMREARRVPGAVSVRGGVRVAGAWRGRPRGGRAGLPGGDGKSAIRARCSRRRAERIQEKKLGPPAHGGRPG